METEQTQSYKIKTSFFEGPLGLLLDLIEKRKLLVNDITLAEVTDDYLNYANRTGKLETRDVADFVSIAATLILIKSKSLLPNLDLTPEEESNIASLEERLRLLEEFRKLSTGIRERFGQRIIFAPLERKNQIVVFLPDRQITKENMMRLVRGALSEIPKAEKLEEVPVKKVVSLEEMIGRLVERINRSLKLNFRDFAESSDAKEGKVAVIVGFLAMLELVRQGLLDARQEKHFEDITIEKL